MNKQRVKILLVDDQPAGLAALESALAELDEALVAVGSGEQALRALRDNSDNTFALVLLNVQMAAMNGFETAALMRRHPSSQALPIIFLTCNDNADGADGADSARFPIEQAYALGAVDFMIRPFNPVVLRYRVSVFIDLYRKSAELALHREATHQAAMRARDERIRLILGSMRDYAFIGTDVERNITEWEGGAGAPAFMCVMRGAQHRFECVNQRFLQLVGKRELLGRTLREAVPELAGQGCFELVDRVYASGAPGEGHNERVLLRRRGGAAAHVLEQCFVDLVLIALREEDGAVSGVLVHGIDVTAHTLAALLAVGQRSALELAVSDAPLDDVLDVLARTAEQYAGGAGSAPRSNKECGAARRSAPTSSSKPTTAASNAGSRPTAAPRPTAASRCTSATRPSAAGSSRAWCCRP